MAAPAASAGPASGSKRARPGAAAERRVQPRHFHFGPNPAAISDNDEADADAAAASPPSPVRLYRDAVGCVFQFLRRGELATALRVSRGWLSAANSMASLRLRIRLPAIELRAVATSAMRRHVSDLCTSGSAPISGDSLFLLAHSMPHLRNLSCELSLPPSAGPLLFPANLRSLHIYLCMPATNLNTTLRAIGQLPLLEELYIILKSMDPQISFAPLAALPQLRRLNIYSTSGGAAIELSDAQVDELRALPQLHDLNIGMSTLLMRRLLRPPHDLQWQRILVPYRMDDEAAFHLSQLPSLTEIDGVAVHCEIFEWLRRLPNLKRVEFNFEKAEESTALVESLVAGLACCTNIEFLSLISCPVLTAAQLADLLPRLPRLRELELFNLSVNSLAFLAQPPLTDQLRTLRVAFCVRLPLTELRHVRALLNLEGLSLEESFDEPMDSHSQSLFTPPSVLLPQLRSFVYNPPWQPAAQ